MSATTKVKDYERSTEARFDDDKMLWFVDCGVKNRSGNLILHSTHYGKNGAIAMNRADAWCLIMSAVKPPES